MEKVSFVDESLVFSSHLFNPTRPGHLAVLQPGGGGADSAFPQ